MTRLANRTIIGLAAGLAGLIAVTAQAQDEEEVTLTEIAIRAVTYDELVSWTERDTRPCCFPEVVAEDGHVLLSITGIFEVPWSEELNRVSANQSDITVTPADGEAVEPIGSFQYVGRFRRFSASFSSYRPSNYDEEDAEPRPAVFNAVFLVPEGTPSVDLAIGTLWQGTVEVPAETSKPDLPTYGATFEILEATLLDSLSTGETVSGQDLSNEIRIPDGMSVLRLEIAVDATSGNNLNDPEGWNWSTVDFGVVYGGVHNAGLIGEGFMDRILDSQFNGTRIDNDPATRTIYFAVPSDAEDLRLFFGDVEIAEITPS